MENSPKTILLIEDHKDVALSTTMLLETFGHTVHHAACGQDGIEMAIKYNPDVILIDIGLPDIDGLQIPRILRKLPQLQDTIMIAVSGYDFDEKARACGFTSYIRKPMNVMEVGESICSV